MRNTIKIILNFSLLLLAVISYGRNIPTSGTGNSQGGNSLAAGCSPAVASASMQLNNVRALIYTGGDMWYDYIGGAARYEIPKNSGKQALYLGSLWLGGQDEGGQLKIAALKYRQNGTDFWTGPLSKNLAEVSEATCISYDKFFPVNRPMVDEFNAWYNGGQQGEYQIPEAILNWPAHGDVSLGQDYYLAPFFDRNGDGTYNPQDGDYPNYDLSNSVNCKIDRSERLYGDSTLWWVFNDKGNVHGHTGGAPIGMEIHAQAFAFATNDAINDMTFYNYRLFNRSTFTLKETYFGVNTDADLGYADDDFIGCDVMRGLGYCYNGTAVDGTGQPAHYGKQPPAVGIDFFEGPYQDNDGIDNGYGIAPGEALNGLGYGDQIVDNERFGMRRFIYYNRSDQGHPATRDPSTATDHYNLLRGIWTDNTKMVYGGIGHISDPKADKNTPCDFMFPGNSDNLYNWGTNGKDMPDWSEITENNVPFDRRFVQSAGPFILYPGAVNDITVGVVWAQATAGGPWASVEKLLSVDDKAQALFDNCFRVLEGPHAPAVKITELNRELILTLENKAPSNNVGENYNEYDPTIPPSVKFGTDSLPTMLTDDQRKYKFEGYQVFQLRDKTVSPDELSNPDRARLIAQTDIRNGVAQLINYVFSEELKTSIPREMVNGQDQGIRHSFRITEDLFAAADKRLVNHKTYHYMAIAYGYNNFKTYTPNDPLALDGQQKPYIGSRKSASGAIKIHSATPSIPLTKGVIINSGYGEGPEITRIDGTGNGGMILDFTTSTENEIMASAPWKVAKPTYQKSRGPVDIIVIDPLIIPAADFELRLEQVGPRRLDTALWTLTNLTENISVVSDTTIAIANEQIIPEWGLSVRMAQVSNPGDRSDPTNGYLDATIEYSNNLRWLTGFKDEEGFSVGNWIRSGTFKDQAITHFNDYIGKDSLEVYERLGVEFFAPYALTSDTAHGPAFGLRSSSRLDSVKSIDIVITNDKSKWTRCPVIENSFSDLTLNPPIKPNLAIGGALTNHLRKSPSVDKEGNPDNSGTTGMGWFPGYAICLETGERLNMAFSEDSWLAGENGADMLWNPTKTITTPLGEFRAGGKHFIYVFNNERANSTNTSLMPSYDEGAFMHEKLSKSTSTSNIDFINVWKSAMWVGFPLLDPNSQELDYKSATVVPSDVRIRLRVARKYEKQTYTGENNGFPMYTFNTSGMAADTNNTIAAKQALSLINVVPNPYYAFSQYEENQLENRIKITNLPQNCEISIYTLNGTLIKRISKGDPSASVDWDLKNYANIPIASGIYLIHVSVPGVGEKTLKWFGVMRPVDLNSF